MESEIESIISERLGSIIASIVLIYIFFWWRSRKKRKEDIPAEGQKEKSPFPGACTVRHKMAVASSLNPPSPPVSGGSDLDYSSESAEAAVILA